MTTTPGEDAAASTKVMRLRYAGTCDGCGAAPDAGTRGAYVRSTKTVRCLTCLDPHGAVPPDTPVADAARGPLPEPVETGTAGSSARRSTNAGRRSERLASGRRTPGSAD